VIAGQYLAFTAILAVAIAVTFGARFLPQGSPALPLADTVVSPLSLDICYTADAFSGGEILSPFHPGGDGFVTVW
jgi:hypothetical protein